MQSARTMQKTLVALTRIWILDELAGVRSEGDPSLRRAVSHPHHGVFVTVALDNTLRGCIGCLDTSLPLDAALEHAARGAVSRDYRFPSLHESDAARITGTISLLGPMERIAGDGHVDIGVHGLLIALRGQRGLLLPQVACEQKWSAERFRKAVCEKAGLPPAVLQDPAMELCRFTAECIPFRLLSD